MTDAKWSVCDHGYTDVVYDKTEGIARIAINRPEVRNAFRPQTVQELNDAFSGARDDPEIGVVILTRRRRDGLLHAAATSACAASGGYVGDDGVPRLNVLDLQRQIRTLAEAGRRDGGGLRDRRRPRAAHGLRPDDRRRQRALRPDRPARRQLRRRLRRGYLARIVGQKKAREIWFLCRQYDAQQALDMGLVNAVVPLAQLEADDPAMVPRDARATARRRCAA